MLDRNEGGELVSDGMADAMSGNGENKYVVSVLRNDRLIEVFDSLNEEPQAGGVVGRVGRL
jgi:hypothetical protein